MEWHGLCNLCCTSIADSNCICTIGERLSAQARLPLGHGHTCKSTLLSLPIDLAGFVGDWLTLDSIINRV